MTDLDHDELEQLYFVTTTASILSLLGCLFIICAYLYFKEIRNLAFRLVFYLSIIDAIHSLVFMIPNYRDNDGDSVLCKIQAVGLTFFTLADVLITAEIALVLYVAVVKEKPIEKLEKWLLAVSLGMPLIAAILPFTTSSYGNAKGWCWIPDEGTHIVWIIITLYGPLWVIIAFNIYAYFSVIQKIKAQLNMFSGKEESSRQLVKKLKFYPIILVVCFLVATIDRIYNFIHFGEPNYILTIIAGFFICLTGILNAIVYGLTYAVQQQLRRACLRRRYSSLNSEYSLSEAA